MEETNAAEVKAENIVEEPIAKTPTKFDPNDRNWVEIGNDVLMQYIKDENGKCTMQFTFTVCF